MIVYPKQHKTDMDKIEKIRQEIERRLNILTNVYAEQVERKDEEMMNYYHGKVIALEELRPFLDTLSEEPDKSLDEAIRLWIAGVFLAYTFPDTTVKTLREIVEKTFIAGAEWQKEQMLKNAVEGVARPDDCEIWVNLVGYGYKFNDGDKVHIIILPKEDKK